jgi:hypothetical protein
MNNLYEIMDSAHGGEAMVMLGREFGLTPAQTQSAVMALLPAISTSNRAQHPKGSATCSA